MRHATASKAADSETYVRAVRHHRASYSGQPAFTLVELLVVVAVIALLVSILLPSLEGARHQARRVKCQANQSAIARASASYQSEENGWLPGSPGTTGSALLGGRYETANAVYEDMPEPPVQIWDWAGPLAARQMRMGLPPNRGDRFRVLVRGVFECPANGFVAVPFHDTSVGATGSFREQRMVSYNALRQFMTWPSRAGAPYEEAVYTAPGATLAREYQPRIDMVGNPSENVFLVDGSRFTTAQGNPDFDINWRGEYGGAFADGGPTIPDIYLRSFWRRDPQRRLSYRHPTGKKVGVVAVFFDAHAEYLTEEQTRYPDRWWPAGTLLLEDEFNPDSRATVESELAAWPYVVRR